MGEAKLIKLAMIRSLSAAGRLVVTLRKKTYFTNKKAPNVFSKLTL